MALLNNWKTYEKLISDYSNASGSALREANLTADSIEGRLNKLSNTWNRTVANVVDSDILKTFISIGTGAIDLVDDLGLLQTALAGLFLYGTLKGGTSLLTWYKNAISSTMAFGNALNAIKVNGFVASTENLSNVISGLSLKQAVAVLSTQNLSREQMIAALSTNKLYSAQEIETATTVAMSSAQGVATGTTWSLSSAFTALSATIAANPIGAAITAITAIISIGSLAVNKYKQAKEEALQTSKELTQAYKDEQQSLDDQISKYKELQEQLKQSNLSTEETKTIKDELLNIQTNLITTYGNEASGLDLVNGKYKEQLGLLGTLSKQKAQDYLSQNKSTFEDAKKALNKQTPYDLGYIGTASDLSDYIKEYSNPKVLLSEYQGSFYLGVKGTAEETRDTLKQLYIDIENFGKESGTNVTGLLTQISDGITDVWTDDLQSYKDSYNEYVKAQVIANDTLRPLYQQSIQAVEDYNKAITSGEGVSEATANLALIQNKLRANTGLVEGSEAIFNELFTTLISGSNESQKAFDNNSFFDPSAFDTLNDALDSLESKSKDTISSLADLNQILSDQANGEKLTSQEAYNLISQFPQLSSALQKTTDGYTINADAIDTVRQALIDQEEANATAQLNMTLDTLNGVNDRVEAYGIELEAVTNLQTALNEQNKLPFQNLYGTLEGFSFDDANKRITTPKGSFTAADNVYKSIKDYYNEQKTIYDALGKVGVLKDRINGLQSGLLSDSGFGVNGKDSGKQTKTELPEEYVTKKSDLEHRHNMGLADDKYFNELAQLEKDYLLGHKEYQSEIWSIDESIYKHKQDILNQEKEQEEKALKESLQNYADNQNNIINLYSKSRSEINNIASSYKDGSDEQVQAFSNGIVSTTSEIKYLEKAIDDLNKKYNNGDFAGNEDIYNSQLESLQNVLSEARSSIQDFQNAIADSTKASLDEVIKAFDDGYEKEKKYWEDQYDAYADVIDAQKEILNLKEKERDYQKDISDRTNEISKIESRKSELQKAASTGDRQAQAELKKLDEENAKNKDDLAEAQHKHEVDLQENALDKALDDNDKLKEAKLSSLEEEHQKQIDNITDVYNQMITMITNAANYTDEQFGTKFQSYVAQLSGLGVVLSDSYVNDVINAQAKSSQANAVNSIIGSYSEANKSQKTTGLSNFNQNLALMGYKTINKDQMVQLAQALGLFDIDNVEDIQDTTAGRINKNRILEELKKYLSGSTFATGGIGEVVHSLGETGIGLFRNGESLLTETQTDLFKDFIKNIKPLNNLVKLSIPNVSNLVTNNNTSSPTFQFGSMIQIMGNADSTVIPKIKSVGDDIVKRIMDAARTR